jgi:hypothetical protein
MSNFAMVEMYPQNKRSTIAVKPYFDPMVDNMGLQKYGLSLFEGAFHEESIACLEINGIKRYITGLNEFAPEIKNLPLDEQEAKITEIRRVVSHLEKTLAANVIDPEDKEFWNKVKLLKQDNGEFWDRIKVRCGNEPVHLDPEKDPYDLIKMYAIEAGGFSIVAKSLEEARRMPTPPKFYLDRLEDTASTKTEVKKIRNKALSELQKLFDKNQNKLLLVARILDPNGAQYKKSTPNDIIYDNMDRYINGDLVEKDKMKSAQRFLDTVNLDMETLKIRAIVKDSAYYKFVSTKADGFIYHTETTTLLGRTQSDIVEYLKNPLNEEILVNLTKKVEQYWNQ